MLKMSSRNLSLMGIAAIIGLTACGLQKEHTAAEMSGLNLDPNAKPVVEACSSGASDTARLSVFQSSVYPFLSTNCKSCHGASQSPKFAVTDVGQAYSSFLSVANLTNPVSSRIVAKSKDGHCPSCNTDGAALASGITEISKVPTSATDVSSSALNNCEPTPQPPPPFDPPFVDPKYIDLDDHYLPGTYSTTMYSTMSFPLSGVSSDLTDVYFNIEIKKIDDKSFLINNFKFVSPTKTFSVHYQGIHLRINDKIVSLPSIETMAGSIALAPNPSPLPSISPAKTVTVSEVVDLSDKISFSFDILEKGVVVGCKSLNTFISHVKPSLITNCAGCHGASGFSGGLSLTGISDEAACANARLRLNLNDVANSDLILMPKIGRSKDNSKLHLFNANGTPIIITGPDYSSWITNWINKEK